MTIYGNLLARGYFPKELPPAFSTEDFSRFARTKAGRKTLRSYSPSDNFTDLVSYRLALPGQSGLGMRPLSIPHPWGFSRLASEVAKHFRRLLKRAGASKIAKSRPVYAVGQPRAIRPLVKPSNLVHYRAAARAGATYLLKVDISQFYPSLYTHAIGWAIDPKLRHKSNWSNTKFLGKRIDQNLMNLQGKVSQGVPIGNDVSFLLAELVLTQIDKGLRVDPRCSTRWYDDYEFACKSRQQAEQILVRLNRLLDAFRLRLNPKKTKIIALPSAAGDSWQDDLRTASETAFRSSINMVSYFDRAFHLRAEFPDDPVLMYAIGALFKVKPPRPNIIRIAESCITQAILAEPGCAQKAFALLTFWKLNGAAFDASLLADTIDQLIVLHESRGVSSDVAWGLAFCVEHGLSLNRRSGQSLSRLEDDAVAILALHANDLGLLNGFRGAAIEKALARESCDGEHWLALYESFRQGFLPNLQPVVAANPLFAEFLKMGVTFYRAQLPTYATLLHGGGAPEWVIRAWLDAHVQATPGLDEQIATKLIKEDLAEVEPEGKSVGDIARELIDRLTQHKIPIIEKYG